MLAAAAARLGDLSNMVWVDLGGGTGVSICIRNIEDTIWTCRHPSTFNSANSLLIFLISRLRSFSHFLQANVELMSAYIDLSKFKQIYVVDLCKSLCEQARLKVTQEGWTNVTVVEGDACQFTPPEGTASLVTFSYSLSMIPPFHAAVDRAVSYLDRDSGLLAITDFYVSAK